MVLIATNKQTTMRKTTIIILIRIMKIINIMTIIVVIDLEATDETMIDHVMEIVEVIMIKGGKAIGRGIVGETGMIMMVKMKIMAMTEPIRMIEGTDLGETEIIEVEEVEVMVEGRMTTMMVTIILKIKDEEETVVNLQKMMIKMNQRRERFIFHQTNLTMKVPCLEMMYRWE